MNTEKSPAIIYSQTVFLLKKDKHPELNQKQDELVQKMSSLGFTPREIVDEIKDAARERRIQVLKQKTQPARNWLGRQITALGELVAK